MRHEPKLFDICVDARTFKQWKACSWSSLIAPSPVRENAEKVFAACNYAMLYVPIVKNLAHADGVELLYEHLGRRLRVHIRRNIVTCHLHFADGPDNPDWTTIPLEHLETRFRYLGRYVSTATEKNCKNLGVLHANT